MIDVELAGRGVRRRRVRVEPTPRRDRAAADARHDRRLDRLCDEHLLAGVAAVVVGVDPAVPEPRGEVRRATERRSDREAASPGPTGSPIFAMNSGDSENPSITSPLRGTMAEEVDRRLQPGRVGIVVEDVVVHEPHEREVVERAVPPSETR